MELDSLHVRDYTQKIGMRQTDGNKALVEDVCIARPVIKRGFE